jgi:hypothetical protein
VLALTTGGWYLYYVFELMAEHSLSGSGFGWFWTALLSTMGIAACAALIGARRVPPVLLAGCVALAVEGYAALVHRGGGLNDMLPAYLAVALLAGLALGRNSAWWTTSASGVLILAQSAFLLTGFHPSQAIPAHADRVVGERLITGMRALGGTVAVPSDPGLSVLAGMAPTAHQGAAWDVLRAKDQNAIASFRRSAANAVAARRFSAIITSGPWVPLGYPLSLGQYYRLCLQPLLAGVPAALFRPVAGGDARPLSLWLPPGSGSCQAVVGLLDGAVKESRR